jgi:2-oxoisovalerate dehydrogenase E1 component alpha subunit
MSKMSESGSNKSNCLWERLSEEASGKESPYLEKNRPSRGKWTDTVEDHTAKNDTSGAINSELHAFEKSLESASTNLDNKLSEQESTTQPPNSVSGNQEQLTTSLNISIDKHFSNTKLTTDDLVSIYRRMTLCRTLDERIWMLNRQGKAAIMASSQGHEAAQIGSVYALKPGTDLFYIYYRDLAVLLELGLTPTDIIKGFLAKDGEPLSGARQFPTHGAHPEYGIVNLSNVVATQIPQAVGAALSAKMKNEKRVVITYFGDGASSAGDTHEAMNFASIHSLPVIFFCENNKYAISVPLDKQMAVNSISSRAEGYGMPGLEIDGCDTVEVFEATREAAERARSGKGPTLIEAQVERYLPHTSDDDDSIYRSADEIEEAKKRDPLALLKSHLTELGVLNEKDQKVMSDEANRIVNEATEEAEKAEYPKTLSFYDHVVSASSKLSGENKWP